MQTESDPATAYNYWAYIRMAFESILTISQEMVKTYFVKSKAKVKQK
jgi:hypothetical protein